MVVRVHGVDVVRVRFSAARPFQRKIKMYLKRFFILIVLALLVSGVLGYLSRNAKPGERFYSYKLNVYERVLYNFRPSGGARDAYIEYLTDLRWMEFTDLLHSKGGEEQLSQSQEAVNDAGNSCLARVEKLLLEKHWQRSQDLAAYCLALPESYRRVWAGGITGGDGSSIHADSVIKHWIQISSSLLEVRANANKLAQESKDRTDFLAGLEDKLTECSAVVDQAKLSVSQTKEKSDRFTYTILSSDIEDLMQTQNAAKKSIGIGVYRDAWWTVGELCAKSFGVKKTAELVAQYSVKITEPLVVPGFMVNK